MGSQVTVNGKTYNVPSGSSVSVMNGVVLIDGQRVTEQTNDKVVRIEVDWRGPLASLEVHNGNVQCQDVQGTVSADGSVEAGDVGGNLSAGGSVKCGNVVGGVQAGGSVKCANVGGSINAGGSVLHG